MVLTTSARESPAASSSALRFWNTRSVSARMPPATIWPLAGSSPTCPAVNTSVPPPGSRTRCAGL